MFALSWLAGCQLIFPVSEASPTDAPDAPGDGAIPLGPCTGLTKTSALADPFDPMVEPSPVWEIRKAPSDPGLAVHLTPEGLSFVEAVPGSVALMSRFGFDLLDSRLIVAISATVPSTRSFVRFGLIAPAESGADRPGVAPSFDWLITDANGPRLIPAQVINMTERRRSPGIPYLPSEHRFLALSRNGSKLRWEVSRDGLEFTTIFDDDLDVRVMRPYFVAFRAATEVPLDVRFDELNMQQPRTAVCGAEELRTDFKTEDPVSWHRLEQSACTIDVEAGLATMTGAAPYNCKYASTGVYDLIEHQYDIDVDDPIGMVDGGEMFARVEGEVAQVRVGLTQVAGVKKLRADVLDGAVSTELFEIEDPGHRKWRIRGTTDVMGNQRVLILTSLDGSTYEERGDFGGLAGFGRSRLILETKGDAGSKYSFESVGLVP